MSYSKVIGIYCIQNIENGKRYVGQSVDIVRRWRGHKAKLRYGKHSNQFLQNAWLKYGEDAFTFTILETLEIRDSATLSKREGYYCTLFRTFDENHGYNIEIVKPSGYRYHSEKSKEKVGSFHRGKRKSEQHKARIAASHMGKTQRPHTEETKKKMSESRKGPKNHRYGVSMSEETKAKLSAALTGKKRTTKRVYSDETKAKMRASAKARWARVRENRVS